MSTLKFCCYKSHKQSAYNIWQFFKKQKNAEVRKLVKVADSDYDVKKKLTIERPVYTVIDQW